MNFNLPIILATTNNHKDDSLVQSLINENDVLTYRGSENDVLKRFIKSAEKYKIDSIIRICSDNPFLSVKFLHKLIESWEPGMDYLSFRLSDGTPSILTHYGFWAEMVSLKALQKTNKLLDSSDKNREHVTSYIYKNPVLFNVNFIEIPEYIEKHKDIRLTLDTYNDFQLQKDIYKELVDKNPNFDVEEVIEYLKKNEALLDKMKSEIKKNVKQ